MKTLYIHIGYPKTGTTTIQDYLFNKHSEVMYLNNEILKSDITKNILYSSENYVNRNKELLHKELSEVLSKFDDKNTFVYSNESLLSVSMFFRLNRKPQVYTLDVNCIARKLKTVFLESNLFSEVKIIVTIRNQQDLIKSMYAQVFNRFFKKFRETNSFSRFLNYSFDNSDSFIIDALYYNSVIKNYEELFEIDNVGVFVFEELKANPKTFIEKMSNFLKIDSEESYSLIRNKDSNKKSGKKSYKTDSVSLSSKLVPIKKYLLGNKSTGLTNSNIFKILDTMKVNGQSIKGVELTKEEQEKFQHFFHDENTSLSQKRRLNLEQYNYL